MKYLAVSIPVPVRYHTVYIQYLIRSEKDPGLYIFHLFLLLYSVILYSTGTGRLQYDISKYRLLTSVVTSPK